MRQNYIAVAKYGNSSITYWKTSWLYFDMKVSFISNGSWKSFYYKSETDVIYTNCGIIDTNSCHSIVAVRFLEGLLQVQCSEWADNPSIIFSIDVTSNETFTNYTDLLHTMLYGYTKEYEFKVEDFIPMNYSEIEFQLEMPLADEENNYVFLFVLGGVLALIGLHWCYFAIKCLFKK